MNTAYKGRGHPSKRTHCPAGHEYTPENTKMIKGKPRKDGTPTQKRQCIECKKHWRPKKAASHRKPQSDHHPH